MTAVCPTCRRPTGEGRWYLTDTGLEATEHVARHIRAERAAAQTARRAWAQRAAAIARHPSQTGGRP